MFCLADIAPQNSNVLHETKSLDIQLTTLLRSPVVNMSAITPSISDDSRSRITISLILNKNYSSGILELFRVFYSFTLQPCICRLKPPRASYGKALSM